MAAAAFLSSAGARIVDPLLHAISTHFAVDPPPLRWTRRVSSCGSGGADGDEGDAREFTDEFKREAVALLRGSGRALTQVVSERGLELPVLRRWHSRANHAERAAPAVRPGAAAALSAEQVEIRRPQKGLERAQLGRDIPAQAIGTFSGPPRRGSVSIEGHREVFPVRAMCSVLHVTANGYHAWRGRPESTRAKANERWAEDIRRVHAGSRRRCGSPSVHASLRAEGKRGDATARRGPCASMASRLVADGYSARPRTATMLSRPPPNLLDRQYASAVAPNRARLADLTCIATGEGWLCLAALMDMFSPGPRRT